DVQVILDPDPPVTVTASVGDGTADKVGDVITYTITTYNGGNVTLTGVTMTDQIAGQSAFVLDTNHSTATTADDATLSGDINNNGKLDVGETWTYTVNHTLTQAEIDSKGDGSGSLIDTATVHATEAP